MAPEIRKHIVPGLEKTVAPQQVIDLEVVARRAVQDRYILPEGPAAAARAAIPAICRGLSIAKMGGG
jgi:hypothetical protein